MARASDHLLADSDTVIYRNTSGDPNALRCLCSCLLGCLGPSDSGQRTREDPKYQQKVENTITYKETFIDDRLLPIYIDTSRGTQSTPP
ncbi:hypothetical protein FNV43_RR20878 [Rhamnella rubrinervis]|uniref:Uncharacterized protein n=1 Tax=Rhamnella rubrinervis TaxID=2594499 RepID=A0A8K0DV76_9ROSA|nr:hypothetical protein FNV43_RR20878 [Rhamnella rubrinervis]